jgi:hypothetical protein
MKTIFITKLIKNQDLLDSDVKIINGKTPVNERIKIYNGFNSGEYNKISITESIVITGGVRYKKKNEEIKIIFLDEIDEIKKDYILSRMNIN